MELGIYGPVTERQKEALKRIARSQEMLLSLINDVLNFAKLDAGQVQYRMADVALHDAARRPAGEPSTTAVKVYELTS